MKPKHASTSTNRPLSADGDLDAWETSGSSPPITTGGSDSSESPAELEPKQARASSVGFENRSDVSTAPPCRAGARPEIPAPNWRYRPESVVPVTRTEPQPLSGILDRQAGTGIVRIAYTPSEAAQSLGVGRTLFFERVLPELRVIRLGRKRLIPVQELGRWADRNAAALPEAL